MYTCQLQGLQNLGEYTRHDSQQHQAMHNNNQLIEKARSVTSQM